MIRTLLRTSFVVLVLTGCTEDDAPPADTDAPGTSAGTGTGSESGATTTPEPTTSSPMSTGATDTTDGTPMTDDGVDTIGVPTTDTGMQTGSDSGSDTGTATTGGVGGDAYGPCVTDEDCRDGETCLVHPVGPTVCAETACTDADDCGMPESGDAFVTCSALLLPDPRTLCWLDCTGGADCPEGMVCETNVCAWPAPGN